MFKGAPKFLTKPDNTIAVQDQSTKFEVLVDSLPKAKIVWLLNGKELTAKDNIKFENDAKTSATNLIIPKILASHLGKYTIRASNSVGEIEHSFDLNIIEQPKISGKLENVTANEGSDARFNIKMAAGKPKPKVKWFIEEEEIITTTVDETYEVTETEDVFTLIIKSVKPENSGSYSAQLYNEAGSVTSNKAQLIVNSMSIVKVFFLNCEIFLNIDIKQIIQEDQFL